MIKREKYFEKLQPFIGKPVIKVITGIRRCGKSTFLKQIKQWLLEIHNVNPANVLLINKDSLEFDWMKNYLQLAAYVKEQFSGISGEKYLFIDEVQEIDGWEKALAGFLSDSVADLYITGSNSKMLSSELATYISGRYIEIKLYTLTFSEFLKIREITNPEKHESEFGLFIRYGGFPGIHQMVYDDEVIGQYVSAIYSTILLKDVVARNNIRDIHLLENITRFSADNCGNITSPKNIADFLKSQRQKASVDTIMNYLSMLTSAYIFHKVNRYDLKGKRHLEIYQKYYPGDIGLKHNLLGFKINDISGHLENIVYLELLSRGYKVDIGKLNGYEIDFVASKNDQILYIQVAYLLPDEKTISREFGSLEKVNDNYPKLVLSLDKYFDSDRNGIQWKNLITFLIEP